MKTNLRDIIQQKATTTILQEKDLLVNISIRVGKTRIGLMSIEQNDSVLICYPNDVIQKSWLDELNKFTPKSLNLTFTTFASLKKHKNKYYDFIIIDEIQKLSLNQINHIKTIGFTKRIGLSGTLSDKTIFKLTTHLGMTVKFNYGISEAIKDKLVKDYKVHIHMCDLEDTIPYIKIKQFNKEIVVTEKQAYESYSKTMDYFDNQYNTTGNTQAKYGYKKYMGLRTNLLYNSIKLFNLAKSLVNQYQNEKCLIYTLRQEIANKLSINSFHSNNKNLDNFNEFLKAKTGHLSAVNCVTAGVTIKHLSHVIFHTYESNTETLMQKIGRSMLYEFDGDISNIHICCLRDTQMEKWINKATKLLEQDKIVYL